MVEMKKTIEAVSPFHVEARGWDRFYQLSRLEQLEVLFLIAKVIESWEVEENSASIGE